MSIQYVCRHCRYPIGTIDQRDFDEARLGLLFLTPEERKDIIAYNSAGDMMVKVVCEYCKQALETHPELSLLDNPLQ